MLKMKLCDVGNSVSRIVNINCYSQQTITWLILCSLSPHDDHWRRSHSLPTLHTTTSLINDSHQDYSVGLYRDSGFTLVSSHASWRLGCSFCFQTNRLLMLEGSAFHGTQELFVLISFDRPFVLVLLCHCRTHEEIWQQPLPLSPTPSALSWQPAQTLPGPPTSLGTSSKPASLPPLLC